MKKNRYVFLWCMLAGFCLASGCGKMAPGGMSGTEMAPGVETSEGGVAVETLGATAGNAAAEAAPESSAAECAVTERTAALQEEAYSFREEPLVIELDPGHGAGGGAENGRHGVQEREVNLQIALKLKEELETYENVTVCLTREDASDVELEERVKKAVEDGADVLVSLHNNAAGSICDYYNGCTVLVARGVGDPGLSEITQELGCYILKGLEAVGSENQGLMFRVTQDELYYDDGSLCDYYSIVRNSVKAGIPGIIVEHAFLDNEEDYQAFFADPEKLNRLAMADAKGIAGYYHLKKKGSDEMPMLLENHTEKITLVVSDHYQDNTYLEKEYFTK